MRKDGPLLVPLVLLAELQPERILSASALVNLVAAADHVSRLEVAVLTHGFLGGLGVGVFASRSWW